MFMRIGELIKYKRQALGYSQKQFAERLEITKQAVSKWENGTAIPDIMIIPDIAYVLKVKPEFLVKTIWIGETGEQVRHFIFVNVKEKGRPSYAVKIYEIDDFIYAKEIYDKKLRLLLHSCLNSVNNNTKSRDKDNKGCEFFHRISFC